MRYVFGLALLAGVTICGCGPKDYVVEPQSSGSHGAVAVKRVPMTKEQIAAQEAAMPVRTVVVEKKPDDARLSAIEDAWPKLTEEQRTAVVKTVKEMAGQ